SAEEVKDLAGLYLDKILNMIVPDNVYYLNLVGEFSFCYTLFSLIKEKGVNITLAIATTERKTVETIGSDGKVVKNAVFEFVRWRFI
ncbi:MAG: hypothetical protein ACK4NF_06980, partial [Planctomycetota bacterium]